MNKKFLLLIIVVLTLVFVVYKTFTWIGSAIYTYSGTRGFSQTISESKSRGVFIKQLTFQVNPDTLALKDIEFFIEKGFLYGKSNAKDNIDLDKQDKKKYQIIIGNENKTRYYLNCRNFPIMEKWEITSPKIMDTLFFDIYRSKDFNNNNLIGSVKVWDK